MKKPVNENQIKVLLDEYLEEHYGREPVLSLVPTDDPHQLRFHLVDETITLSCDESGRITEKKRKRRLPKTEVEGQLSLSDVFSAEPGEAAGESVDALLDDTDETAEESGDATLDDTDEAAGGTVAAPSGSPSEGKLVSNIYTGAIYEVIGSAEGIVRARPKGELSTIMLSAADVREVEDNEQSG